MTNNVSFGLEGLYYSFDSDNPFDDSEDFWVARARVSYHFTPGYDSEPLK